MRIGALVLSVCLAGPSFAADSPLVTQAGYVAYRCAQLSKELSDTNPEQLYCSTLMAGFLSGWAAGVNRGITAAFVMDEKNMATTLGAEEAWDRMQAVRPKAQCLALSGMKFKQIVERFVVYVTARPERSKEGFDQLMTDMIRETICSR